MVLLWFILLGGIFIFCCWSKISIYSCWLSASFSSAFIAEMRSIFNDVILKKKHTQIYCIYLVNGSQTRPNMSAELLPKISKLSHGRMEQTCPPRSAALCVCAMRAHLIAMFSRQDSLNSRSVKKDRRNKGVAFAPKMNQQKQVEVHFGFFLGFSRSFS